MTIHVIWTKDKYKSEKRLILISKLILLLVLFCFYMNLWNYEFPCWKIVLTILYSLLDGRKLRETEDGQHKTNVPQRVTDSGFLPWCVYCSD